MDKRTLPFEIIGGREPVFRLVDRFYDLMETDPAFKELRDMHDADLTPMRESLTDFLSAWLGGPRDWFEKRPGACIMSMHGKLRGMQHETATQWVNCMERALQETSAASEEFNGQMMSHLRSMAMTMAVRNTTKIT